MSRDDLGAHELRQQIETYQKAVFWGGSALIVGALLGFGAGIKIGRDLEKLQRRLRDREATG